MKKFVGVFVGTALIAIGALMLLIGNEGVDPISSFALGLSAQLPWSISVSSLVFNCVVLLAVWLLDRRLVGWGSLINALGVGFFLYLFNPLSIFNRLYLPWALHIMLAIVVIGFGIALYLLQDLGAGPVEGLMLYISERFAWPMKWVRIGIDTTLVVCGAVLGAQIGWSTGIAMLVIGPAVAFWLAALARMSRWTVVQRFLS